MCIISGIIAAATAIGGALTTAATAIGAGATAVGASIASGASAIGGAIASGAGALWGGLQSIGTALAPSLVGGVAAATEGTAIGSTVAGTIGLAAVGTVGAAGYSIYNSIRQATQASDYADSLAASAQSTLGGTLDSPNRTASTLADNRKNRVSNTLSKLKVPLTSLATSTVSSVNTAGSENGVGINI